MGGRILRVRGGRCPCRRGASTQAHKTIRIATLTAQGHDLGRVRIGRIKSRTDRASEGSPRRSARGARGSPGSELNERGISTDVLQRLAEKGLIAFRRQRIERDPFTSGVTTTPVTSSPDRSLTDEQTSALEALEAAAATGQFSVFLLQGVTGSGKTEVYLRLSDLVQRRGKSVLVLVPEIALTPAVASAFRAAFGDRVAVQHSGLSDGERSDQWYRIRRGDVSVVVGTRSAVFAPLTNLGLIIVDEEHDTSFKQEETPRYQRPRRGGDAGQARRRARRARLGDAVAREQPERRNRALHAPADETTRARTVRWLGVRSSTCGSSTPNTVRT